MYYRIPALCRQEKMSPKLARWRCAVGLDGLPMDWRRRAVLIDDAQVAVRPRCTSRGRNTRGSPRRMTTGRPPRGSVDRIWPERMSMTGRRGR